MMRWKWITVDQSEQGETHTAVRPCKGDWLEFGDGRQWLVERVMLRAQPRVITDTAPIGALVLRPINLEGLTP
ncbi:MAG: hypothetical protein RLZZ511_4443 [Cyanobacteriota bacterium]|jgi:hypothetical protein